MVNANVKHNPNPNLIPNPNPYPTLNLKPNHYPHSYSMLLEISSQEQLSLEQMSDHAFIVWQLFSYSQMLLIQKPSDEQSSPDSVKIIFF